MVALRVTSEFWISAFKKRLEGQGIPIFVIQKGDNLAGAIIIRVSNLRGNAKVFIQEPTLTGERSWIEFLNGSDIEIEAFLENQIRFDQLFGIHFGIIIPISRRNNEEFHYF